MHKQETNDFNSVQFCTTCGEWVDCNSEVHVDAGLTHGESAYVIATRSQVCPECGSALMTQTAKHFIDLEWKTVSQTTPEE